MPKNKLRKFLLPTSDEDKWIQPSSGIRVIAPGDLEKKVKEQSDREEESNEK